MHLSVGDQVSSTNLPTERHVIRNLADLEDLLEYRQVGARLHLHVQPSSEALTRGDFHKLTKLLRSVPSYIFLDLHESTFLDEDMSNVIALLSSLSADVCVYGMDFSHTTITTSALISLIPIFNFSSVLVLNLSYTMISDRFFEQLLEGMDDSKSNLALVSLSLQHCYRLGTTNALSALISRTSKLRVLDLTGTSLQLPTIIEITDLLYEQESLQYLFLADLTCFAFTTWQPDWQSFVKQFIYNLIQIPEISVIDLSGSAVGDIGAYYLEQIVAKLAQIGHSFALRDINLSYTEMTDKGVSFMKQFLYHMGENGLMTVNLIGNGFSMSSIAELQAVSVETSVALIFDPCVVHYGMHLFPRLLEKDTQYMDKYSRLSAFNRASGSMKLDLHSFFNNYDADAPFIDYSYDGAFKIYSDTRATVVPYLLRTIALPSQDLPIIGALVRKPASKNYGESMLNRENISKYRPQLFFTATGAVYSQINGSCENRALDSITYSFSSDKETPDNARTDERLDSSAASLAKPNLTALTANPTLYLTGTETDRGSNVEGSLATSALASNVDSIGMLSALLQKEGLGMPLSPFFKRQAKGCSKDTALHIAYKEVSNVSIATTAHTAASYNEPVYESYEAAKSVPVTVFHENLPLLVHSLSTDTFAINETEIARQKESDLSVMDNDLQENTESAKSISTVSEKKGAATSTSESSISGDKSPLTDIANRGKIASDQNSLTSSSDWESEISGEKVNPFSYVPEAQNPEPKEQNRGTKPQKGNLTFSSSDSDDGSPFSSTSERSAVPPIATAPAANMDEWSSPNVKEPTPEPNKPKQQRVQFANVDNAAECTSILSPSILKTSEAHREKLHEYMAQTSDDPHTSKCSFVNKIKVWISDKHNLDMSEAYAFMHTLDGTLRKAKNCHKLEGMTAFTATANMHMDSLLITWFDSLKQKCSLVFVFKDIATAELVGSGKTGIICITTARERVILSIADKRERILFSELLYLFTSKYA